MGYSSNGSYRLWDIASNKLIVGRSIIFNETAMLKRLTIAGDIVSEANESSIDHGIKQDDIGDNRENIHGVSGNDIGHNEDSFHDAIENNSTGNVGDEVHGVNEDDIGNNNEPQLRRSTRQRRVPNRYGDWNEEAHFAFSAQQFVGNDLITMTEAKQRDDWHEWIKAIQKEYSSIIKNKTWTECNLPIGRKPVSCKWVFKLKRKSNGDIDKYKARLVARGFSQTIGFDYNETYAPVIDNIGHIIVNCCSE